MNNANTVLIALVSMIIALLISALSTGILIPILKKHQFEQAIRDFGPKTHLKKQGTPSMGGIAMVIGITISSIVISLIFDRFSIKIVVSILVMLAYSMIGFVDDYLKAIQMKSDGLSAKKKLLFQFLACILFALFCYFYHPIGASSIGSNSSIWIPYVNKYIDLGIFYIPYIIFIMIAFTNSVNLTDGLDGLASGITAIVSLCMVIASCAFKYMDLPIVYGAVCGACVGFILYNHYPAKIFMGDTGSMALGGIIAASAIMMKLEFLLAIAGFVYVCESLSVIIQVSYFKATHGKRIFKMSPIHHHFELCGMKETHVVLMFYAATLVFCTIMFLGVR